MWLPSSLTKVLIDPEIRGDLPKQTRRRMRGYLLDFLKPEALKHYVPVKDSVAKEHLMRDWFPNDQMRVFPSVKDYTFTLACRNFMNIQNDQDVKKLCAPFANIMPGLFSVPDQHPGTPFNTCGQGREQDEERSGNGRQRRGDRAQDNRLLVASHETTSTAITMTVNYLAQFPHIYDQVYKEQQEIAKNKHDGETLTLEDTQKMKYSWNVACESMRLSPRHREHSEKQHSGLCTRLTRILSTSRTQRSSDPMRFEGGGPVPFSFVPFGGGPRMCPGKEYARIQILTFIHNLVVRFRFEKVD
ncbi:hypothetical protein MLD38_022630 [Melastoma candidum]|uniref:Uncharacterized protein n=1 Tax=Melastoma candidum TaxID=119954 RepID=A0ACB9QJU4_9MYRT|nr:hypothetical protein MLD38_022630 [Melastoma candidum]